MPSWYAIHAVVAMGFLNNAALRAEELGLKNERILPFEFFLRAFILVFTLLVQHIVFFLRRIENSEIAARSTLTYTSCGSSLFLSYNSSIIPSLLKPISCLLPVWYWFE